MRIELRKEREPALENITVFGKQFPLFYGQWPHIEV